MSSDSSATTVRLNPTATGFEPSEGSMKQLSVRVVICTVVMATTLTGQSVAVRLPDESEGIEGIARALVSAFDQVDVLALGEAHGRALDSDLRLAIVRHPEFPNKVRSIVVEFGSATEQVTLDRYIQGEKVSQAQLEHVWKSTTQARNGVWDDPIYAEFFAAVRDVNAKLPTDSRIRVFGGDPGPGGNRSRETTAVSILKEHVLQKKSKALVVYGAAHFYRNMPAAYLATMGQDVGLASALEAIYPGRTMVVIPVGGRLDLPPAITLRMLPDYQKFDRALKTRTRPVLVPLSREPFGGFSAEEFVGGQLITCAGSGGCRSVFNGSPLTLRSIADAVVYVGNGDQADARAR
jgi:hypothetical protein